jgi:hypothetical protein
MPTQQRRRCHHEAVPALLRKQTSKRSEKRTIGGPKPRRLMLARQDRELVPQSTSSTSLVNSARRLRTSSFKQQRRQGRRNRAASTDTPRPSDRSHRLAVLAPFSGSWYSHARVASKSYDGPNRDRRAETNLPNLRRAHNAARPLRNMDQGFDTLHGLPSARAGLFRLLSGASRGLSPDLAHHSVSGLRAGGPGHLGAS